MRYGTVDRMNISASHLGILHLFIINQRMAAQTGCVMSPRVVLRAFLGSFVAASFKYTEWSKKRYSSSVFEKTWSATQKNVKSHVFLDFEKKRKKTYVVSQAT